MSTKNASTLNQGYTYSEEVGPRAAARSAHEYLSTRYRHSSTRVWLERIAAGQVLIDGERASAGEILRLGQTLSWHRPPWREPNAPLDVPVLYEAEGIMVVRKPAGLPTMAGGGFLEHTLVHQLRVKHPDAAPMHRLGRWTSGAVVCATTQQASRSLAAQFSERSIYKRYRALLSGRTGRDAFDVEVPIGPVPYAPLGTLHAASPAGRPSASHAVVVERRAASTLCDVTISTGRPHQIRIHMAAAGHPLLGDPLYVLGGVPAPDGTALPGDPGYQLHAAEVGFRSASGDVRVHAPPPGPLRATQNQ